MVQIALSLGKSKEAPRGYSSGLFERNLWGFIFLILETRLKADLPVKRSGKSLFSLDYNLSVLRADIVLDGQYFFRTYLRSINPSNTSRVLHCINSPARVLTFTFSHPSNPPERVLKLGNTCVFLLACHMSIFHSFRQLHLHPL